MRLTTKQRSSFLYLSLKFLIIPASRGYNQDVAFLGRNTSLMLVKPFCKLSRWHVALSRNRITLRFSKFILQSNLPRTVAMISLFVNVLLFKNNEQTLVLTDLWEIQNTVLLLIAKQQQVPKQRNHQLRQ